MKEIEILFILYIIQYNTSNIQYNTSNMKAIKQTREEKEEIELNSIKIHTIIKKKNWGRIPRPTMQEEEGLLWYLCAFPWY